MIADPRLAGLRKRTPEHWQNLLRRLPCSINMQRWVACKIWWDFMSGDFANHLDLHTRRAFRQAWVATCDTTHDLDTAEYCRMLRKLGYIERMIKEPTKFVPLHVLKGAYVTKNP